MAGTSIDLSCNLKADVGYRFRHVEGGDMFGYAENGGPGYDKGLNLHEARIGAPTPSVAARPPATCRRPIFRSSRSRSTSKHPHVQAIEKPSGSPGRLLLLPSPLSNSTVS